ncbi:MAG: helix-turn-helix transcriptional regulator [Luteitalea sp.]|nr:helix-turn-helix transcriptional regulator [Luteitalea sp.]
MRDYLQHARECYGRRTWAAAYEAFSAADQKTPLDVDDLERLATSAYLIGRDLEFERCLDRLHRAYVEAGDRPRAARSAFWLCLSLLLRGEVAQSSAWGARGQRRVEGVDCVERGYLLLPIAELQLHQDKAEAAHATAATAAATGERFRDADLTAAACHVQGRALIQQGHVVAGLGLLDETMLAVIAGELSPIMTGLMYCSVIEACREVCATHRAREWTFALSGWCEQQSEMVAFTGVCLVHRAEIMQFHGAWPEALAEACRACERAKRVGRKPPAAAFYQQAEIHRLRGECAEAEEAYRAASRSGCDPQPGLALLRMAQGRTDAASAAIRRLVTTTADRRQRARLLPAYLEIMLATGDIQEARSACGELQALAETFDADVLRATAARAHGAIELAEGDARAALGPLRCAFEVWARLDASYECARVRVLLGQACRALGDNETSALEFGAARAVFEHLGARPELMRLDTIDTRTASSQQHPLTARERDVLRLIAAGKTNKAIAAALCVSGRTIDRHVSNILNKLDVPSRAAATAYAYDHKLL